jgi:hypothetical protein
MVFVLLEKLILGWRYLAKATGIVTVELGSWYLFRR